MSKRTRRQPARPSVVSQLIAASVRISERGQFAARIIYAVGIALALIIGSCKGNAPWIGAVLKNAASHNFSDHPSRDSSRSNAPP